MTTALSTTKAKVRSLTNQLEKLKPDIGNIVGPLGINIERFCGIAMLNIRQDSKLLSCDARSLLGAICRAANLGLELDRNLGFGWLVPHNNRVGGSKMMQAEFWLGYKGIVRLAENSPLVSGVVARLVWEDEIERGLWQYKETDRGTRFEHEVDAFQKRDLKKLDGVVGAYSAAYSSQDGRLISIHPMSIAEIMARKNSGHAGPAWQGHPHPMARKCAIRGHLPFLPISTTPQGMFALAQANREELLDAGDDARIAAGGARPLDPEEELKGAAEGYVDIEAEVISDDGGDGDEDTASNLERALEDIETVEVRCERGDAGSGDAIDLPGVDDVTWAKIRDVCRAYADTMPGKAVKDRGEAVQRIIQSLDDERSASLTEAIEKILSGSDGA